MIRGFFTSLKAQAQFIVLLAVAAAGAIFYVQAQRTRADRDDIAHRVEIICAKAQSDWSAVQGAERGVVCARRVADLLTFKTTADQETARVLAAAMEEANARTARDNDYTRFRAMIAASPYFRELFPLDAAREAEMVFPRRIVARSLTGNVHAAIGANVMNALLDEINFMRIVEDSAQAADGGRVQGVGAQAVDRLGRKGDQSPAAQHLGGAADDLRLRLVRIDGQHLGVHAVMVTAACSAGKAG